MPKEVRVTVEEVKPSATDYDEIKVSKGLPHDARTLRVKPGSVKVGDALTVKLKRSGSVRLPRGGGKISSSDVVEVKRPDGKSVGVSY